MIQYKLQREQGGITRIFNRPSTEAARVWVCTGCGAKVFHCKTVPRPQYKCFCGGQKWNRQ